jgi:ribonuclease P protein component
MLARSSRLRAGRDIVTVYKKGAYASGGPFFVRARRTGAATSRAAIVVSRKVSKSSVARNRIRRRLSAVLEALWQTIPGGYDIVITAAADISDISAADLEKKLFTALNKSGVL